MADIKLVISDPKTGKAYNMDVTGPKVNKFIGRPIGSEIDGETAGLPGYKLIITGGTDKTGVPMRGDIPGQARRRILVAGGIGYHPAEDGMRRRKLLNGNEISSDMVQVNAKVAAYGEKTLDELAPKKEKKDAAAGGRAPAHK